MLYCIYSIQYTVHAACTGYRVTGLPGLWDTVRCDVIGPGHPSQPRLTVDYLHTGESNACILNIEHSQQNDSSSEPA